MSNLEFHSEAQRLAWEAEMKRLAAPNEPIWREILRWICFLPGSLLGGVIAYQIARGVAWLGGSYSEQDSRFYLIITIIGTSGFAGWSNVFCGAWVAPRGKVAVAYGLVGLFLFLSGGAVVMKGPDSHWTQWLSMAAFDIGMIASAIAISSGEVKAGRQ